MKKFKVFVITKRKLQYIISGSLCAAVCIAVISIIVSAPKSVAVFSRQEENSDTSYIDIIDQGMPTDKKSSGIKEKIYSIIGINPQHPETIIDSSSAVFSGSDTSPAPADNVPTDTPQSVSSEIVLPSHDEITSAVNIKINNSTNYNIDLNELCKSKSDISLTLDKPEVLIMHTHTTECFVGNEMTGESERTTNPSYNMCAVGDVIADTLESYGIKTIHDTTIHDYPSYQGAYTRALETINSQIEKNPDIKVVLDIHRDAYIYSDGSKLRVASTINGAETAQAMIVCGTDSMGLYHPYWKSNLTLAAKVQNAADIMFPGLMRPINLRRERFNMHVTRGSLLIEIGSNGNTLEEAKRAGSYIAHALAAALLNG